MINILYILDRLKKPLMFGMIVFMAFFAGNFTVSADNHNTNQAGSNQNTAGNPGQSNEGNVDIKFSIPNPLGASGVDTLPEFIKKILDVVLTIGVPVVAFFIILAGFKFVTANGNQSEITKAKENFYAVIIGSAILLGAWVLANAIGETVNELTT